MRPRNRFQRRPVSALAGCLLGVALFTAPARAGDDKVLTVVTWGGAYEASQRAAYFEPFTAKTGIPVKTVRYDGDVQALRDHLRHKTEGGPSWDVIDMVRSEASTACDEGLLTPLDASIVADAPDGTSAQDDFIEGAFNRCDITQLVYATVIAYDDRAFPGVKPRTIDDFFDLEKFPGKRALRKAPVGILEWALLSRSVPRQQLYNLLSTERGLNLAFRQLDRIRDAIVWWRGGDEPVELLKSGKAAMASGYNGRFFNAGAIEGEPISVIWDGQLLDYNSWAIPAGTDNRALAERFIRFATRTENMAVQSNLISYGPARKSAQRRVGLHAKTGMPMRPHMPTARNHLENAVRRDDEWYVQTHDVRYKHFEAWLDNNKQTGNTQSGQPEK